MGDTRNKTDDMKSTSLDEFKLEAMRSMGWSVEADIPMAKAENLSILQLMVGMRAEKFDLQQRIIALDERDKAIERHKRNIESTLQQNIVSGCPTDYTLIIPKYISITDLLQLGEERCAKGGASHTAGHIGAPQAEGGCALESKGAGGILGICGAHAT